MTIIRPAEPEDAPRIAHVHVESWRTTYPGIIPAEVLDNLETHQRELYWHGVILNPDNDEFVYVAENDEQEIVGFASASTAQRSELEDYEAELFTVYLLESAQGSGIGRGLMTAIAQHLLANEVQSLMLWVAEQNSACAFYEKLGGENVGKKTITVGGADIITVAYGWRDIHALLID